MKIYLHLDKEAVDVLIKEGVYRPKKALSMISDPEWSDLKTGYRFASEHLNIIDTKPEGCESPVWAWASTNRVCRNPEEGRITVKAVVDETKCLFTDFAEYHNIINNSPVFPKNFDWDDEDAIDEWYAKPQSEIEDTWESIVLHPNFNKKGWINDPEIRYCQINFWELKLSDVYEIKY